MSHDTKSSGTTVAAVRERIEEPRRERILGLGLASFLVAGTAWLLTLGGIVLAPWWAKIPLGLLNGVTIGILFIVGHDACHGILLPRRWLNRLSGRLCLWPALHPYAAWVHNHNGLHHAFTNIKEKDPGFPPLDPVEYRALPAWRRWLYRRCRAWYGLGLLNFVEMWLKWEVLPAPHRTPRDRRAFQRDRIQVAIYGLAWIGLLALAAWWQEDSIIGMILIGFVVPQAVWHWLIGFIVLQQHTHPRVPWFSELDKPSPTYFQSQVQSVPHLIFPAPFRFLLRHVMEHTAHHADPGVPLYQLTEAQRALDRAYRRDIVRVMWTPATFLRTLRTCRLYDYSNHRWVDYDGTALTEQLLMRGPELDSEAHPDACEPGDAIERSADGVTLQENAGSNSETEVSVPKTEVEQSS